MLVEQPTPMILYLEEWLSDPSILTDTDAYKVQRFLDFLASLLEQPRAKVFFYLLSCCLKVKIC